MPWIRSAATAARSSDSRNAVGLESRYGSNSSPYSSHAASRSASPPLSTSRSGSAPTSGSALPGGMTSLLAPSCAPASITCATSSSRSGTISSPPSPRASAARASRKSRACSATWSASSRHGSDAVLARGDTPLAGGHPRAPDGPEPPALGCLSDIERPPSLEGPPQRHLVGVLQVTADGQAAGRPGYLQPERLAQPGQVRRGRLALEVRVSGQDQLRHVPVGEPGHQLGDPQVLGPDAVHRADRPAEHVVPAAELADLLDRRHVLGLFYHADHRRVPPRVQADPALVVLGDVAARAAELDLLDDLDQRRREAADILGVSRQQVERDPQGALRADPGQLAELVDQVLDDSLVHLSARPRRVP